MLSCAKGSQSPLMKKTMMTMMMMISDSNGFTKQKKTMATEGENCNDSENDNIETTLMITMLMKIMMVLKIVRTK